MATDTYQSKRASLLAPFEEYLRQRCEHPQVMGQKCRFCGYDVGSSYGIQFDHVVQGLRLSREEATRFRQICTKNLLRQKKLHLVLDIDHTLLHTVPLEKLIPEDVEFLKENAESLRDSLVTRELESSKLVIKLRPFVQSFLKEASSLFEMYLYTRGTRLYATNVARLLDPQDIYFGNRIISREDTTDKFKTLKLVAAQDRAVLIIDDTESMWPNDKDNLILVGGYDYFHKNEDGKFFMWKTDESETDGALARMLKVIRELHGRFFAEDDVDIGHRDIRLLKELVRSSILEGCKVHVSYGPFDDEAHINRAYKIAKELGAECCEKCNSSVTHVIAFDWSAKLVNWVRKQKKYMVNPKWIETAYLSWQRQHEENFPIDES